MIRGKSADKAATILSFTTKRAAYPLLKLLNSCLANAKNNFKMATTDNLYVAKIEVNDGRKLKRMRPRARGQGYEIQKKTSHIILVLDEKPQPKKTAKKSINKKHDA